jgi:ribosomal protein S28E/S33
VTVGEIGDTCARRLAIVRTFGVTGAVTAVRTTVWPAELRARTATRSVDPRSLGITT